MSRSFVTVRRLELPVREGSLPWDEGRRYDTVGIVLDGRDLEEWVSPRRARSDVVGAFLGRHVGEDLGALLLGRAALPEEGGRSALLSCSCTVVGCGGLLARVEVGEDTVVWSDFARSGSAPAPDDELELHFERSAYEAAVADLERRLADRGGSPTRR